MTSTYSNVVPEDRNTLNDFQNNFITTKITESKGPNNNKKLLSKINYGFFTLLHWAFIASLFNMAWNTEYTSPLTNALTIGYIYFHVILTTFGLVFIMLAFWLVKKASESLDDSEIYMNLKPNHYKAVQKQNPLKFTALLAYGFINTFLTSYALYLNHYIKFSIYCFALYIITLIFANILRSKWKKVFAQNLPRNEYEAITLKAKLLN